MRKSSTPSCFRDKCLSGKVALVTGGGSGIGRGICQTLMELGCHVAIMSRDIHKLNKTAKELMLLVVGGRCVSVCADVRNDESVGLAVDKVIDILGSIDILVNAAAGNFLTSLNSLTAKGFKTVMEIDALGTFICSKHVFHKCFQKQQQEESGGGVIVNISMTLHYCGTLLQTHAGAAKAAVDAMTKHMAVEWGPYNVRVNGVAPGPIASTEGLDRLMPKQEDATAGHGSDGSGGGNASVVSLLDFVPLRRLGQICDVSNLVCFLCMPEASFISGTTIVVDGGQWLTSCNFTALHPTTNKQWQLCKL
eukprot:GHVS01014954.1.p1 GENE.GHVS01014954.1~~GHVS01014954.1.p1  ORF type:complete len:307 (+),score=61.18 GHVS01014954.1:113-1033(+)